MSSDVMKPLLLERALEIRFYDIDQAGVVNNIVYIRWLSDMRHAFLEQHIPIDQLFAEGLGPAIARTEIDYKYPLRLGDRPVAQLWVHRLGRGIWGVTIEICLGEQLVARAMQEGYFVSTASLRPKRVPAQLRAAYEAAVAELGAS